MKYLIPILLTLSLLSCQSETGPMNPEYDLKGSVKKTIDRSSENPPDKMGQLSLAKYPETFVYEYDPQGYLQIVKQYFEKSRTPDTTKQVFYYDDQQRLTRIKILFQEKHVRTVQHRYDSLGQLTEEVVEVNPNYIMKRTYNYDDQGRKTGEAVFRNDKRQRHWVYHLDDQGTKYLEGVIDHEEEWADEITFVYNNEGQVRESNRSRATWAGLESNENITYQYDQQGQLIERVTTSKGVSTREVWEYEYDRQGNWTYRAHYRIERGEKQAVKLTLRELEYY